MFAILAMAITDLFYATKRTRACLHLQGFMFEAALCAVDQDWIRLQLRKAGVSIDESEFV